MDELTDAQRDKLEQLRQVTNGDDPHHELAVLESVGWDVAVSPPLTSSPVRAHRVTRSRKLLKPYSTPSPSPGLPFPERRGE